MNAEQKERAIQLITTWRTRSITTRPDESAVYGDCMTDILQELVDAPAPEPVARVTGYYAGYLSIATVDGRVLPAGTALYAAPPHQSEHHLEMVNTPAPSVPADVARDAARYRWLTADHASAEARLYVNSIASSIRMRSYAAISAAIDAAITAEKGGA